MVLVAGNLHTRASRHSCVPLLWDRMGEGRSAGEGRMMDSPLWHEKQARELHALHLEHASFKLNRDGGASLVH